MNITDTNERQDMWNQLRVELDPMTAVRQALSEVAEVLRTLGNTTPGGLYRGGREAHIDRLDMLAYRVLGVWPRNQPLILSPFVREFFQTELTRYRDMVEDRDVIDKLVMRLQ